MAQTASLDEIKERIRKRVGRRSPFHLMDPTDDYILNSADQRWHHLIEKEPDLAAAIDLQRIILTRTLELPNEAPEVLKGPVMAPPGLLDR